MHMSGPAHLHCPALVDEEGGVHDVEVGRFGELRQPRLEYAFCKWWVG